MNTPRSLLSNLGVVLAGGALIGTLTVPPAEAGESRTEQVVGGWVGELPCPVTSAKPTVGSPTSLPFVCISGTTWDGDWVGHTVYRAVGTFDVVSGDFHATLDETLTGLAAATRAAGTLHLVGTVDVVGATGAVVVRERIVGGTGAFQGSSGTLVFTGDQVALVVGHGGYQGTWTHP